jgi:hypothetical protein
LGSTSPAIRGAAASRPPFYSRAVWRSQREPSGQPRPPAADRLQATRPARAAEPPVGSTHRAVNAVEQMLMLLRTIGNAAVVRLMAASSDAGPRLQRAPGDWLVINRDNVPLRKRRTTNSKFRLPTINQSELRANLITTLNKGRLGFELEGRNDRWVRLRIPELEQKENDPQVPKFPPGWIRSNEADVEPATARSRSCRTRCPGPICRNASVSRGCRYSPTAA